MFGRRRSSSGAGRLATVVVVAALIAGLMPPASARAAVDLISSVRIVGAHLDLPATAAVMRSVGAPADMRLTYA